MINRNARDQAASALEEFLKGVISNEEYERRYPNAKDDPALHAIFTQVWLFYSDKSEHTLSGKHALSDEARDAFERCILFLRSDLEFQWPIPTLGFRFFILRLLGFGKLVNQREEEEMRVGDKEVWPFISKIEYHRALQKS
jgi:hypothetical protein